MMSSHCSRSRSLSHSLHRFVLCSASAVFRRLFAVDVKLKVPSLAECPGWSKRRLQKISPAGVNTGEVRGFLSTLTKLVHTICIRCLSFKKKPCYCMYGGGGK